MSRRLGGDERRLDLARGLEVGAHLDAFAEDLGDDQQRQAGQDHRETGREHRVERDLRARQTACDDPLTQVLERRPRQFAGHDREADEAQAAGVLVQEWPAFDQPAEDPPQSVEHHQDHGQHTNHAHKRKGDEGHRRVGDSYVAAGVVDASVHRGTACPLYPIRRRIDLEARRQADAYVAVVRA